MHSLTSKQIATLKLVDLARSDKYTDGTHKQNLAFLAAKGLIVGKPIGGGPDPDIMYALTDAGETVMDEIGAEEAKDRPSVLNLDDKHVKSYATEKMLHTKMDEDGVKKVRYLICRTPSGRWTAVVIGFEQHLLGKWPMVG